MHSLLCKPLRGAAHVSIMCEGWLTSAVRTWVQYTEALQNSVTVSQCHSVTGAHVCCICCACCDSNIAAARTHSPHKLQHGKQSWKDLHFADRSTHHPTLRLHSKYIISCCLHAVRTGAL